MNSVAAVRFGGRGDRRHDRRAHGRHPLAHGIQRIADALRRAVVEDLRGACPAPFTFVAKPCAALDAAGIVVEVGVRAAHRAPVEDALIVEIVAREGALERNRLARAGLEDPRDVVGVAVVVARGAARPGVVRGLAAIGQRIDVAQRDVELPVAVRVELVRQAERREERELADEIAVLCVPGAGGALDSMSRAITVLSSRLSAEMEVFSSLLA